MKRKSHAPGKFLTVVLTGGLFLSLGGCENAGTVSGSVRYKGQLLSEGNVSFLSEKGQVATGAIDKSGRYVASHVPVGPAKVTVMVVGSEGPPPISFGPTPQMPQGTKAGVTIPLRYSVAATSGLQHTVTKGKQEFDIDLKE